jgi:hypothetical protein
LKPFPHIKYGFLIGYEFAKLIIGDKQNIDFEHFEYKYDGTFSIGLFLDNPILLSDFSLHTEVYFAKHGYSFNTFVYNEDIDFVANLSSLKVPFLIKYAYPSNKIRPFINMGIVGTYFIKNETLLYKTTISENTIEINDMEKTSIINDIEIGYSIGGGIEYKLNFKNSLFFELRYNNPYSGGDSEFLGISTFNVFTGKNF